MVEIKSEAAHFNGLAAAFMLASINSAIERLKKLIVAQEQSVLVDCVVTPVNRRVSASRGDYDCLLSLWNLVFDVKVNSLRAIVWRKANLVCSDISALYAQFDCCRWKGDCENTLIVGG
jgi:hypothetical protein